MLVSVPAYAGNGLLHDHIPLPPASPAFESSNGDRYGRLAKQDNNHAAPETDLERFARSMGADPGNGRVDVFKYPLQHDENGDALPGPAMTGTVANGAAQLQLRWTTQ
jgi:hypothetical protein